MLFYEVIAVALGALRAHKMRSFLTMLGIAIGIGAVIAMVALGNGAQRSIEDRIARLGTTVLQVNPQRVRQQGVAIAGSNARLTVDDVEAIRDRSPSIASVNYQQDGNQQVVFGRMNANVRIVGTIPNFLQTRGFRIADGRMFNEGEEVGRRRVAVLGASVLDLLEVTPLEILGQQIRIAGRAFDVIGVLEAKGAGGWDDPDNQILIPFSTGRFQVFGHNRLNDIWALAVSEAEIDPAMAQIQAALRRSHRLGPNDEDDFRIRNQTDFLQALNETTETFGLLLAGIAAVSLVVGGIGIMNIMLVSVTERTREIGVRKALGATRVNLLLQFLVESVVLCLVGGAIGIAGGIVGSGRLAAGMGWSAVIDPPSVLIAFGFATATGILFGVWPARRAARMDPVVALRYE